MRRLKQILASIIVTTVGLVATDGVYALQFSGGAVPLTFTFNETMTLTLEGDLALASVNPGQCVDGGTLTATVATNAAKGYTLNAKMNGATDTLASSVGTFAMTNGTAALSAGTWGIRVGSESVSCTSTTYKKLNVSTGEDVPLNKTKDVSGTKYDASYGGTNSTAVRIGAYASTSQVSGTYTNTIVFTAVSNT